MEYLWMALVGLVVGAIAKFIVPGKDPGGIIVTALIGVAGSLLATFLGQQVGWYKVGATAGFLGALVGAIVLLILYRLIRKATGGGDSA